MPPRQTRPASPAGTYESLTEGGWVGLYFRGAADRSYGRHESVTPSGNRNDEAVLAQLLAEGAAQGRNILSEVVLFDDGAAPDRAQQLVLGHGLPGVQDQMHERFDRHR